MRPPIEAQSLIFRVTRGCSHNRCTFCPTYKGTRFRIRKEERIRSDVEEAAQWAGYEEMMPGEYRLPDTFQLVEELVLMIAHSEFTHCYFTSNHASN